MLLQIGLFQNYNNMKRLKLVNILTFLGFLCCFLFFGWAVTVLREVKPTKEITITENQLINNKLIDEKIQEKLRYNNIQHLREFKVEYKNISVSSTDYGTSFFVLVLYRNNDLYESNTLCENIIKVLSLECDLDYMNSSGITHWESSNNECILNNYKQIIDQEINNFLK